MHPGYGMMPYGAVPGMQMHPGMRPRPACRFIQMAPQGFQPALSWPAIRAARRDGDDGGRWHGNGRRTSNGRRPPSAMQHMYQPAPGAGPQGQPAPGGVRPIPQGGMRPGGPGGPVGGVMAIPGKGGGQAGAGGAAAAGGAVPAAATPAGTSSLALRPPARRRLRLSTRRRRRRLRCRSNQPPPPPVMPPAARPPTTDGEATTAAAPATDPTPEGGDAEPKAPSAAVDVTDVYRPRPHSTRGDQTGRCHRCDRKGPRGDAAAAPSPKPAAPADAPTAPPPSSAPPPAVASASAGGGEDDDEDDWETKDESELVIKSPEGPPKDAGPPGIALRPGGAASFASATKAAPSISAGNRRIYPKEFLMLFEKHCTERPASLKADLEIIVLGPDGAPCGQGEGLQPAAPPGLGGAQGAGPDEWRMAGGGLVGGAALGARGGSASFDPRDPAQQPVPEGRPDGQAR